MKIEVLEGFTTKPPRSGVFPMDRFLMVLFYFKLNDIEPWGAPAKVKYAGVWI